MTEYDVPPRISHSIRARWGWQRTEQAFRNASSRAQVERKRAARGPEHCQAHHASCLAMAIAGWADDPWQLVWVFASTIRDPDQHALHHRTRARRFERTRRFYERQLRHQMARLRVQAVREGAW